MTCTVRVERTVNASPERLFEQFLSSERLAQLPATSIKVLGTGHGARDDVGMVRRVDFPGGFLVEEIVALEPGRRFDYLIRDAPLAFRHDFGRIEFRARPDGRTDVTWTSRFAIPGRLSGLKERALGLGTRAAFAGVLRIQARAARQALTDDRIELALHGLGTTAGHDRGTLT